MEHSQLHGQLRFRSSVPLTCSILRSMTDPLNLPLLAQTVSLILGLSLSGTDGPIPLPLVETTEERNLSLYDIERNRIVLPGRCAGPAMPTCRGLVVHELAHWLLVQHRYFPSTTDPSDRFDAEMAARYVEECALLRRNEPPEYLRLRQAIRNGWRPPALPKEGRCQEQ